MPTKPSSKSAAKTTAKPEKSAKADPKAAPPKAAAKEAKADPKPAAAASKGGVAAKPVGKELKAEPKKEERVSSTRVEAKAARDEAKATAKEEPMTMPRIAVAAPAVAEERPTFTTTMSKPQLEHFRGLLEEKRDDIIKKAKETLEEDMTLDTNDLPDEMDLASSEYLQSFTFRLRGREKSFLDKITKALERIDNNSFGVCEECGDEISVKRLEARPETTLCIRCKEDQERAEKDYG
jgi:DnaK suppressor protein